MYRIKAIFSNVQLLKKIGITLLLLFIFRITTWIPIPLLDTSSITDFVASNGFLAILNNFTGNALGRFSIMAMGISPYITASIVIQLLQMDIVPILKEWSEQGETGKQKLTKLTRILGLVLAFVQAMVLLLGLGVAGSEFLPDILTPTPVLYIYMSLVVAAGTAFAMWIADFITKKGIGNGTSLLIVAGIITSLPSMITLLWEKYITNGTNGWDTVIFISIMLIYLAVLLGVTFLELAKRKVPIQYANRHAGQGKTDSNLPIKLNSAGVIPVIFASTILSIPLSLVGMFDKDTSVMTSLESWLDQIFNYQQPIGFVIYIGLIVVFTFFYSFLMLNPEKVSDNLSKSNAYIPGVRPGMDTQNYIAKLMFKITLLGTVYLVILAAMPIITAVAFGFNSLESQTIVLGGTSLLIVVGVAMETTNQIETEANSQEYKGIF
jgi:preprotein translocase subunit SecY